MTQPIGLEPIPVRLPCPDCGRLHIDRGEFATKPHHTHACQYCGNIWRPAVVHTVGVRFLPGFKNKPRKKEPVQEGTRAVTRSLDELVADTESKMTGGVPWASHWQHRLAKAALDELERDFDAWWREREAQARFNHLAKSILDRAMVFLHQAGYFYRIESIFVAMRAGSKEALKALLAAKTLNPEGWAHIATQEERNESLLQSLSRTAR